MSVPTLPVSQRFFSPEISVYKFLPVVAEPTVGATRAEIAGGIALQDELADLSGWDISPGYIETPDAGHRVVGRIPGRTSLGDASMTFYASQDGEDIRKVLTEGQRGYMYFADGGDVEDYLYDLYAVQVSNIGVARSVTGNTALQLPIGFALLRSPLRGAAIPAAA